MKDGKIIGVHTQTGNGTQHCYEGDEFVLATGHSARDVYESLNQANVKLEPKGFAVGFRVEHPQAVINKIQYGDEWGPVSTTIIQLKKFIYYLSYIMRNCAIVFVHG